MERNRDQEPTMDAGTMDANGPAVDDNVQVEQRPQRDVGRTIAQAREAKGLSQADLAQSLNLDLRIVEQIEAGRYDLAPEPIYVRAYLKSWAGALDLDPATLIQDYDRCYFGHEELNLSRARSNKKLEPMGGTGTVVRRKRGGGGGGRFWLWLLAVIVLGIVAFVALELLPKPLSSLLGGSGSAPSNQQTILPLTESKPAGSADSPSGSSALPPPQNGNAADGSASALPSKPLPALADNSPSRVAQATGTPLTGVSASADAPKPEQTTSSSNVATDSASVDTNLPPPAATADNLVIKAQGADCWVEVKNADGTRLMYDVLKSGSERRFGGKGPFSVVLGNPQAVEVLWKGKPVQLGSGNATTGVVRVTVGGS